MAQMSCSTCLQQSIRAVRPRALMFLASSFSTLNRQAVANNNKNKKTLRLSKNVREKTGKPPTVGERRAFKRRVILNNPNAIAVEDLEELNANKLRKRPVPQDANADPSAEKSDEHSLISLHGYRGQVLALEESAAQALMALEMFRPTQSWRLFQRPATVIRSETVRIAEMIHSAETRQSRQTSILHGPRGSGKSVLLLQAAAIAQSRGWVVIHIPEAKDLINAHTSYRLHAQELRAHSYTQPHYVSQLLRKVARANAVVLNRLQVTKKHDLPIPMQANMSLARLAELGRDVDLAWMVWNALWDELTTPATGNSQDQRRPPIMFSIDDVNNVMGPTAYLDKDSQPIHAHDLALIQHFRSLLTGKLATPQGSLILGATTQSNGLNLAIMDYLAQQKDIQGSVSSKSYVEVDQRVIEMLGDVQIYLVNGLDRNEARGLVEYYARCGLLLSSVTDSFVAEKWSLAGGGLIGNLERSIVRPVL